MLGLLWYKHVLYLALQPGFLSPHPQSQHPWIIIIVHLQGVIRPGLLSLRERYRLRGRELAEDGLVLAEQLDAAREGNAERLEELAALRRQVRRRHSLGLVGTCPVVYCKQQKEARTS